MGSQATPLDPGPSGERTQLSRDRVATAALSLIDHGGLAGLSMRKLGAALGVEAMSIYHYVSSKDDLLDAVLELLCSQIEIAEISDEQGWEHVLRLAVESFHRVLQAHPHSASLFAGRSVVTNRAGFLAYFRSYRTMRQLGLSPVDSHTIVRLAVSYVLGHAIAETGATEGGRSVDLLSGELLDDPEVAEFALSGRRLTAQSVFAGGLDVLVAGIRSEYGLA